MVPPDLPPSATYWFGTTSRGQDVFWQVAVAIRNTLLFGITVALVSRVLSLVIGLLSVFDPQLFPHDTVWSYFGRGYLFVPLVLPILGLWWLARHRPVRAA